MGATFVIERQGQTDNYDKHTCWFHVLKETRNLSKMQPLDFEKKWSFWNIKKNREVGFLKLNIFRKVRITVVSSSQGNVRVFSIFWVIQGNVVKTHERLDF